MPATYSWSNPVCHYLIIRGTVCASFRFKFVRICDRKASSLYFPPPTSSAYVFISYMVLPPPSWKAAKGRPSHTSPAEQTWNKSDVGRFRGRGVTFAPLADPWPWLVRVGDQRKPPAPNLLSPLSAPHALLIPPSSPLTIIFLILFPAISWYP
ncbi:hypothetical protein BCR34DRAFT_254058 [Clohesyomyces aquaticus]|uniref:Uncharacterized protein n=1 Tax=Clohesyomyces aquaticus TaxID=1231657 RepID=A0A1Y1Y4H0_9PLEO|nr:hypothetical protein BCR34DRAFT_254058 [Clohesyomyces aquaticus]